jgi:hypothetical protein
MKRFISLSGILSVLILFLSSCATIIHGGDQDITINTYPSGANVKIINLNDNSEVGTYISPCIVNLERGYDFFEKGRYSIEIEKPGYAKKMILVRGSIDGWYIVGNFFSWEFLGWFLVDPATGAMWKLKPEMIYITLPQAGALKELGFNNGGLLLDKTKLTTEQFNTRVIE